VYAQTLLLSLAALSEEREELLRRASLLYIYISLSSYRNIRYYDVA
jgi:hypothetical protein